MCVCFKGLIVSHKLYPYVLFHVSADYLKKIFPFFFSLFVVLVKKKTFIVTIFMLTVQCADIGQLP